MTDTKDDDHDPTRGTSLPPPATPAAPSKPAHDETHIGGSLPILPGAKPPPRPVPDKPAKVDESAVRPQDTRIEDADDEKTAIDEDLEETIFEVRSPFSLVRVKPPGHAVPVTLSESSYVVGRSRSCDIQLFTPSSHRRHAKLLSRAGAWVLEPIENSVVIANGDLVRGEIPLVHRMRLQLGDDELVFYDERKAASPSAASEAKQAQPARSLPRSAVLAAVVAAVVVVGFLLWWWVM